MSATKVHMTLDEELLEFVDRLAARERRTRSGMVQELIRRERDRMTEPTSGESGRDAAARAIAALHELADADFGADDLPEPEDFPEWRRRLWAGSLHRRAVRPGVSAETKDEIKKRAIAAVLSTEHPLSGEPDFTDIESYRRWREQLWSGTPRYAQPT